MSRTLVITGVLAMMWFSFIGVDLRSGISVTAETIPQGGDGDWRRQLGYLAAFGLVMLGAFRSSTSIGSATRVPAVFFMLFAWCAASVLWAIVPGIAARRLALTGLVAAVAIVAAARLGVDDMFSLVRKALAFMLVVNLLAVATLGGAVHPLGEADPALPGLWRGLYGHKNTAGGLAAVSFIIFYFDAWSRRSWVSALFAAGALVFLLKTGSKTSLAILPAALLAGHLIFASFRSFASAFATVFGGVLVSVGVGWIDLDVRLIEGYLDDPTSFTGRNQIWPILVRYANDNPVLGSGFGSFWGIGADTPLTTYASGWLETVAHGHNGYLDILAQTGVPGLLLVIAALIVWPLKRIRFTRHAETETVNTRLFASLVMFFAAHNLLETSYLDRDNPLWLLTMLVMACLFTLQPRAEMTEASMFMRFRRHDDGGVTDSPAPAHDLDAENGGARSS